MKDTYKHIVYSSVKLMSVNNMYLIRLISCRKGGKIIPVKFSFQSTKTFSKKIMSANYIVIRQGSPFILVTNV